MAVITVTSNDGGMAGQRWKVPDDNKLNMSNIPRGIRMYQGTKAIAALGANDETAVNITFSFPTQFVYLCKSMSILFQSDDLTTEFSNFGSLEYYPAGQTGIDKRIAFILQCQGASSRDAAKSSQVFNPIGTWRRWVNGPLGDTVHMRIADISGDTSTAGDIAWYGEFYEFDVEQCMMYPVNVPNQVLNY